jgi:hypothetical protein
LRPDDIRAHGDAVDAFLEQHRRVAQRREPVAELRVALLDGPDGRAARERFVDDAFVFRYEPPHVRGIVRRDPRRDA